MTITVRYQRIESYVQLSGLPARPCLAVRLQHGDTYFDTYGLVDSGADRSIFHLECAQALGLAPRPEVEEEVTGIGGSAPAWAFDIYLSVAGKRFPARVKFTERCPREFGLLGREDFFNRFEVGFQQRLSRTLLHSLP